MTTAIEDVTQLILRERQCRDRGWWDQMADCFAEGSSIRLSWFSGSGAEFVNQSRAMTGRGDYAVHRLSPPAVRLHGNRAHAEVPLTIQFRFSVKGIEAYLDSNARSQYRAEQTDGVWRIVAITSIYERDSLYPAIPGTRLEIDSQQLAAYRPSYRCLAWYLNQKGYKIGADLLGDDQPEAAARQYEAEAAWLAEAKAGLL